MNALHRNQIAVIVPVWNGMRDLPACLSALDRQQGVAFDIIAVDNASTDGSPDYIAQYWPDVQLIRNRRNLGFSRACNIGLEAAMGRSILVLLNQDTEVFPDWLAQLIAPLQEYPSIGVVGSKAIFPNGKIQHAGGTINAQGLGTHIGRGEQDHGQYGVMRQVDFVTGAALAITREAYEAVGGLDENYSPAYFEDVDWCYRVRNAGYHIVYVPDSMLVHKEGPSLSAGGHEAEFMLHRNRLRFVLKHWPLDKLRNEFMPTEEVWLDSLGHRGETIVGAMHHAYLHQLIRLDEIIDARSAMFADDEEELEGLAAILLGLRAVYPLKPAKLNNQNVRRVRSPGSVPSNGIVERMQRRFPRFTNALLSSPLTRPLVRLSNQQKLAEVLVEYIRENNREISELAQEIEILKNQVQDSQSTSD